MYERFQEALQIEQLPLPICVRPGPANKYTRKSFLHEVSADSIESAAVDVAFEPTRRGAIRSWASPLIVELCLAASGQIRRESTASTIRRYRNH